MNILLLSQFFSSTRGGGEYLFHLLAKNLAENDHKVWIITNKINNEIYPSHKNIKIIFVKPILVYKGGLPPSFKDNFQFLLNAVMVGRKIIKENEIDIIHSNNFTPALVGGILAVLTSKVHITSIWDIFTLCGCDYWKKWARQAGVSKINQIIGPIFEKLVLKIRCQAIHTISNSSKEDLIKFGARSRIQIIAPTIEEIKSENNTTNKNQFIFIGRLVFYKNVEILIKAIKIVKKQKNEVKLIVIGNGPQLETLKNMVEILELSDNIVFKGFVGTEEKSKLIAGSNALLFPSLCEGFGLVILEAFQQKKPVLVSDISPMSDIIDDGKTGFIIDHEKEEEWAQKIIHLIDNENDSELMGENGYLCLKEKYNQDLFYQNIIQLYNSMIQQ